MAVGDGSKPDKKTCPHRNTDQASIQSTKPNATQPAARAPITPPHPSTCRRYGYRLPGVLCRWGLESGPQIPVAVGSTALPTSTGISDEAAGAAKTRGRHGALRKSCAAGGAEGRRAPRPSKRHPRPVAELCQRPRHPLLKHPSRVCFSLCVLTPPPLYWQLGAVRQAVTAAPAPHRLPRRRTG